MKLASGFILLVVLCIQSLEISSQVIPAERRISWSPGIPSGGPNPSSPIINVVDFGADTSGLSDCFPSITQALQVLGQTGGILYFPTGTYRISKTIQIEQSHIILRGAGCLKTRLISDAPGNSFQIAVYNRGEWQTLAGDIQKDRDRLVVSGSEKFMENGFAEIAQDNDSSVMYTKNDWNQDWAQSSVGQIFEISGLHGDTLLFKATFHTAFSKQLNARIRPLQLVSFVGFEDFSIKKTQPAGNTFNFQNAAYCRIKNVESDHTRKAHVYLNTTLGCEIRDSYFHHSFDYGGGGSGYGIQCGYHATDNLIENNIFNHLRHSMLIQTGANGNVFAYNYSLHTVQGNGETDLNNGWIPPDISVHGHYPFMNLFESNVVEEIGIADFWGPAGPGNTYFRNEVRGEGIFYYDHSHYQNLIGNITRFIGNEHNSSLQNLETGNVVLGQTIWANNKVTVLQASLYLKAKPGFFNDLPWPVIGPDITSNFPLPAEIRYKEISRKHN